MSMLYSVTIEVDRELRSDVERELLDEGLTVIRDPYEGMAIGGSPDLIVDAVRLIFEAAGAVGTTISVTRWVVDWFKGRESIVHRVHVDELQTEGLMEFRCDVCGRTWYSGQLEGPVQRCRYLDCGGPVTWTNKPSFLD